MDEAVQRELQELVKAEVDARLAPVIAHLDQVEAALREFNEWNSIRETMK